jgi:hypothetical protein
MTWRTVLKGDPLPWLLEPENPSVRYWTLTDILDRPADDPEVREAQAAIPRQPLVQELFARQHPDGHWGKEGGWKSGHVLTGKLLVDLDWRARGTPSKWITLHALTVLKDWGY